MQNPFMFTQITNR